MSTAKRYQNNDAQAEMNDFRKLDTAIRIVSVFDLILGFISMLLQVGISATMNHKVYRDYKVFNGTGIWVGIVYLIAGSLGFASGSLTAGSKRNKLLIWALAMSAICVPLSWLLMASPFSFFSLVIDILRKIDLKELMSMKIALGVFNIGACINNIILTVLTSIVIFCVNGCCSTLSKTPMTKIQ